MASVLKQSRLLFLLFLLESFLELANCFVIGNRYTHLHLATPSQLVSKQCVGNGRCLTSRQHQQRRVLFPLYSAKTAALVVGHVVGGALAAPLTAKAIKSWYMKIKLPSFTPPNKLFGPTWTLLYASMGFSVARILKNLPAGTVWYKTQPMQWWMAHYALNLIWAPVFFGAKKFRLSAAINLLLLGSLLLIYPMFQQVDTTAAFILIPYIAWIGFANALNLAICRLNPGSYNNARFESDLLRLQKEAARYSGITE